MGASGAGESMQVWDKRQSVVSFAGAILFAMILTIIFVRVNLNRWLWLPVVLSVAFYCFNMRRYLLRRRWASQPFPEAWRKLLEQRVPYYRKLDPAEKLRFETDVLIFLKENRITGVETVVDDSLRLLVAASAIMLTFGYPDWEYRKLPEILIYPYTFDEEYRFSSSKGRRVLAGQVVSQSAIVLVRSELEEGFANPEGAYHVGLHEFAHALENLEEGAGGIPRDLDPRVLKEWYTILRQELQRVQEQRSVLDQYGGENTGELFAVAVEHFFQRPLELKRHHPELYRTLAKFLNQDPAAHHGPLSP